jgi:hypothetical protein
MTQISRRLLTANSFLNPRNNSLVHMSFIEVNAFRTAFVHIDDFGVIEAE